MNKIPTILNLSVIFVGLAGLFHFVDKTTCIYVIIFLFVMSFIIDTINKKKK